MDQAQFNPEPGSARCPGPSTHDYLVADGDAPAVLLSESPQFLGDGDIDFQRYISQDFFDREIRLLWPRIWQWACREEHLPQPGSYFVFDIGPHSIILVRGEDGKVNAFRNACAHRATQLKPSGSSGTAEDLRCPFHGWTYDLAGKLRSLPCWWDFPHVKRTSHSLQPVKCESWGGFLWINMDPDAPPLAEYLAPLTEHFAGRWDLSRRTIQVHIQKELPNNWKACAEAFLEAYHVLETHSQYIGSSSDANTQYDILGQNTSRFVQLNGVPSPHYKGPRAEQDILDRMIITPPGTLVPEGETARSVVANELRKVLSEKWGSDLSGYSTGEMVDAIEYFVAPNAFFFPGVTIPGVYRFRPIGNDPGKTLFDLLILRPLGEGETVGPAPEPVRLRIEESYTLVDGIDPNLAYVYDQDTSNLEMQWRGFHASARAGQSLGNYQEARIRHLHQMIDRYLQE